MEDDTNPQRTYEEIEKEYGELDQKVRSLGPSDKYLMRMHELEVELETAALRAAENFQARFHAAKETRPLADPASQHEIDRQLLDDHESTTALIRDHARKIRELMSILSPEERGRPDIQQMLVDIHRLGTENLLFAREESRISRRQYWLGLGVGGLLGLPIGVLGTWLAAVLGVG